MATEEQMAKYSIEKAGRLQHWHFRMMDAAKYFGGWSKCLSRQIGAVIVEDKTIISSGYNGPPRGVSECFTAKGLENFLKAHSSRLKDQDIDQLEENWGKACPRQILGLPSGTGLEYCIAGHAEANAIANAARKGVEVKGAAMYCYCPLPCMNCSKMIIGAGIDVVFHIKGLDYDPVSRLMLDEAGVKVVGVSLEMMAKYEL
jgi:dCMP deaminase